MKIKIFFFFKHIFSLSFQTYLFIVFSLSFHNTFVFAYKQSQRKEDDIAIVNACAKIDFVSENSSEVKDTSIVFGGMAAKTLSTSKTANSMKGK